MNKDLRSPNTSPDPDCAQSPEWLLKALRTTFLPSERLHSRCLQAADEAWTLAKLRNTQPQMGLPLLTVSAYMRGLAAVANVPLAPALLWAGLKPDSRPGPRFAAAWAKLASALGAELRQALLHLRLSFAEFAGLELAPLMARHRGASGKSSDVLDYCEAFLAKESRGWDKATQDDLRVSERAVEEYYVAEGAGRQS